MSIAHFGAQGSTLFFSASQVRASFSIEAHAILQALRWSEKHQQLCSSSSLFFLRFTLWSCYIFFSVFLTLFGTSRGNYPVSPFSVRLYWVPGHSFLPGNPRSMSLPNELYCFRHLQYQVVSILLHLVFTHLFFRTGGVLFHLNSSTHRYLRYPLRNLCSSSRSLRPLSSSLQQTQLSVKLLPL